MFRQEEASARILPNQTIFLLIGDNPHTFVTRVEDIDNEYMRISGINSVSGNAYVFPNQKIRFFFLSGNTYYRAESVFLKQVEKPLFQWVLSKPQLITGFKDRRYSYRLEHVLEANIKNAPGLAQVNDSYEFLTKNISTGGMMLVSKMNLSLYPQFSLSLPALNNIEFSGRIVWSDEEMFMGKWHYGIRFIHADEAKKIELSRYIDRISREKITIQ